MKRVLVATDFSPGAGAATAFSGVLARGHGCEVDVVHVRPPAEPPDSLDAPSADRPMAPHGRRGLRDEQVSRTIEAASETDGIVACAADGEVDLIVLGTRGAGGARRASVGSVARSVVHDAPCPVLLIPDRHACRGLRRIAVAVDFSGASRDAIRRAHTLAEPWDGRLIVLHVVDPATAEHAYSTYPSSRPAPAIAAVWERRLVDFAGAVVQGVDIEPHVRVGPAGPTIINFALEHQPDLLVVGAQGASESREKKLGSVALSVTQCAFCPVMTVRGEPVASAQRPRRVRRQTAHRRGRPVPA